VLINDVRCNAWLRQQYERLQAAAKPGKVEFIVRGWENCSQRCGAWLLTADPSFRTYLQSRRRPAQ
jgi:hypothetical protein